MRTIRTLLFLSSDHWLNQFVEFLKTQDLSELTVRGYFYDLDRFRRWIGSIYEKEVLIKNITSHDILAYRHHMTEVKKMKATTVNREIQSIRKLFSWALANSKVTSNIALDIRFLKKASKYCPSGLKPKEIHTLLSVAGASPHGLYKRNYAIVQTLLQTGIRAREITRLKFSDMVIHARSGKIRIRDGKGLREREIPLNSTARRALQTYINSKSSIDSDKYVFQSKRGESLSIRALQGLIQSLARRAKLQRIPVSPHTLRHTFAINFLKANQDKLVELANLMGHESLDTTAIYVKPTQEEIAEDLERSALNAF